MQTELLAQWRHAHDFLGARHALHERRTWAVVGLTVVMMITEIGGGTLFGSMALVADGLHMATHVAALSIAAVAYSFARRHVDNDWFSFGTGKFGELAAFASAIILAMVALLIGYESVMRLVNPVAIRFAEAIPIAVLGLAVNLLSVFLLHDHDHHHDEHDDGHEHDDDGHDHAHHHAAAGEIGIVARVRDGAPPAPSAPAARAVHGRAEPHDHDHDHGHDHHADHNFRAAYMHVLADAFTSVLAIAALATGAYFGFVWLDPIAGLIGMCVITVWAYGLIRSSGAVLLDAVAGRSRAEAIRHRLESGGDHVADLHLWRLGPGHLGLIAAIVTARPCAPDDYKALLHGIDGLSHITIEVNVVPR